MNTTAPVPPEAYDALLRALHWLVAILILLVYALAQVQDALPRGAPREIVLALHESLGLAVVALLVLRLARRFVTRIPFYADLPAWQRRAADAAQCTLYALMVAVPVVGLVESWARGRTVVVFGLFALPGLVERSRPLARAVGQVHELAAHLLVAIAAVHAAAALWHHFISRDGVLVSMLPRLRRRGAS